MDTKTLIGRLAGPAALVAALTLSGCSESEEPTTDNAVEAVEDAADNAADTAQDVADDAGAAVEEAVEDLDDPTGGG